MQTDWTAASYFNPGDLTRELVKVSASRLEFRVKKAYRAFALLFFLGGIGCAIGAIHSTVSFSDDKDISIFLVVISFVLIVAGYLTNNICIKPVVFDKLQGHFWKGGKTSDEGPGMNTAEDVTLLDDIYALQLIYWDEISRQGTKCPVAVLSG
jgi:uncharacterized transporter YbjL